MTLCILKLKSSLFYCDYVHLYSCVGLNIVFGLNTISWHHDSMTLILEYVRIILSFRQRCNSGSKQQIELKNISLYGHLMPSLNEKIVIMIETIKKDIQKEIWTKNWLLSKNWLQKQKYLIPISILTLPTPDHDGGSFPIMFVVTRTPPGLSQDNICLTTSSYFWNRNQCVGKYLTWFHKS